MENRASRHCISKIIDTHDKQDRAENTSLWDSTNNGFLTGAGAIYQDTLPSMHQEWSYPLQYYRMDTIALQLFNQEGMVDLRIIVPSRIESFSPQSGRLIQFWTNSCQKPWRSHDKSSGSPVLHTTPSRYHLHEPATVSKCFYQAWSHTDLQILGSFFPFWEFGLAPYFTEILVKQLHEVPFYNLSFDESFLW